jgi:hypothetical protein
LVISAIKSAASLALKAPDPMISTVPSDRGSHVTAMFPSPMDKEHDPQNATAD